MAGGHAWGRGVSDARRASTSTEDPMLRWADDPQPLETVRARTLDRAASDVQALLSEHVRVLIHQTECATCLAALTQLGRKSQIPPDLLVKFQPIDIVEVIL
jgi:hypothetical protein